MTNTTHNPERDINDKYIETASSWIKEFGEALVIIRYLYGGRDYALLKSKDDLLRLIELCPEGADIIILKGNRLPNRGVATESFIASVRINMSNEKEYLYVKLVPEKEGDPRLFGEEGYVSETLVGDLRDHENEEIAVGACPNYIVGDNEDMISASKGGIDGPR